MLTDRRKLNRQDVSFTDSIAWFSLNHRLYPIHIANRSDRGFGVTIRQRPPFGPGDSVRIDWLKPSPASADVIVRSVLQIDVDEWYVGLEMIRVETQHNQALAPIFAMSR